MPYEEAGAAAFSLCGLGQEFIGSLEPTGWSLRIVWRSTRSGRLLDELVPGGLHLEFYIAAP